MKIEEKELNATFGNVDVTSLCFMTLSAIPIDGEIKTLYGIISRKSLTRFEIKISDERVQKVKKKKENINSSHDSVMELFT